MAIETPRSSYFSSRHPSSLATQEEQGAGDAPRLPRWALLGGAAVIAVQLLAFDMVVERHARHAQERASSYVTVTLQQPHRGAEDGDRAQPLLLAGN